MIGFGSIRVKECELQTRCFLTLGASFASAVTVAVSDGWGYVPRYGEIGIFEVLQRILPEVRFN